MLVPTTEGDKYHTAGKHYIKYDKNKHVSLTKNTYNTKSTHTHTHTHTN